MHVRRPPLHHLLDASPSIFAAWYALPDLRAPDGRPVSATIGFASSLIRHLGEHQPASIALAFDESLDTCFRNDVYPAYKSERAAPDADLLAQLEDCREVAEALGVATHAHARYEADDLIGTLAHHLAARGDDVLVVSIDKDLAQLVGPRVTMLDTKRNQHLDAGAVLARFGVTPGQIPDLLGLAGDPVDGIPGVAGVGPKTARVLLEHFADLDALYGRLDEVPSLPLRGAAGVARKLEAGRELALLSRELATIVVDAPIATDPDRLRFKGLQAERLDALCERLGAPRVAQRARDVLGQSSRRTS